ncbi:MAG: hypothetical protein MI976_18830 [Pseudomonadales bacterium]|nr:hypothetical protein [Pseudomonadales bacterium]
MIQAMQGLANRVFPIRFLFVVIAFFSLFGFLYIALSKDQSLDLYLFPSLVSFGWCICLFGIADVFMSVPEEVKEGDGFFLRIKKRIRRSIAWVWSYGFMACTVLLVYLSYKSVSLAIGGS